jgi:hypothetical protein
MTPLPSRPEGLRSAGISLPEEQAFQEVLDLVRASRGRVLMAVNSALIELYWKVGELVVRKIQSNGWGKSTVAALSAYIQKRQPGLQGFSPQNLWRVRQFFEAYRNRPDLSTLLREVHPAAEAIFRDAYFVEFLDLPDGYHETDLHAALLQNMRRFVTRRLPEDNPIWRQSTVAATDTQ